MQQFKGQLKGHGLKNEGQVINIYGWGTGPGYAYCSCGAVSSLLQTTAARKRWHQEHKAKIWNLSKDMND